MKNHLSSCLIAVMVVSIVSPRSYCQPTWSGTGLPLNFTTITCIYADTVDNSLYVAGITTPTLYNGYLGSVVARYTTNGWDTLGTFENAATSILRWGDTLIFTGHFDALNGQPCSGIVGWVGNNWIPFGSFQTQGIDRLRILNGELYAVGAFDYADGQFCNGVAKRTGGQWVPVGNLQFSSGAQIVQDIALYRDTLVICGQITAPGNIGRDIMAFDGTDWFKLMEEGLVGNFCSARSLIEYQGDLIVTGPIDQTSGNAGHSVQRWDGNQWHAMGAGLTVAPGVYTWITGGYNLMIRGELLYVTGGFYCADGVAADCIATWDGSRWCGFGQGPDLIARALCWYQDTMYLGMDGTLDGADVNCLAKYIGNYPDTCSQFSTGIPAYHDPAHLSATLNCATSSIEVTLPQGSSPVLVQLFDPRGVLVVHKTGAQISFSTQGLATGIYLVHAVGYPAQRVLVP